MIRLTLAFLACAALALVYRTAELATLHAALNVALALALGCIAGVLAVYESLGGRVPRATPSKES